MRVYHGSDKYFGIGKPSYTRRTDGINIKYEGISFHATPLKWIALSYTYNKKATYMYNKTLKNFGMGVSLFKDNKLVIIHGKRNLDYSLKKLYGKGGYLYTFNSDRFKHVKGLGPLEVISYEEQVPDKIEYIEDPVEEMRKLGVRFIFVNEVNRKNG